MGFIFFLIETPWANGGSIGFNLKKKLIFSDICGNVLKISNHIFISLAVRMSVWISIPLMCYAKLARLPLRARVP